MILVHLFFWSAFVRCIWSLQPLPQKKSRLVIYGLGNIGRMVAQEVPSSWSVHGTQRSFSKESVSIAIPFSEVTNYLPDTTHVLITIPPTSDVSTKILADLVEHLKPETAAWVGFVSTSGVYGNHDGAWVTEESQLLCSSSALAYVKFEQDLFDASSSGGQWPATAIFRCAGLYGHTRSALHTVWKKRADEDIEIVARGGNENDDAPLFVSNRIHERDVARAIVSAMTKGASGVYNLADDEPEARSIVMKHAAQLFVSAGFHFNTVPMKPTTGLLDDVKTKTLSKRGERRKQERKLVSNSKMKADLIDELLFPTFREGLDSILKDNSNPWWIV